MNEKIEKLDEEFMNRFTEEVYSGTGEGFLQVKRLAVEKYRDYLHARDAALIAAIAEAVKTETEAKMAQGKYTYAHEVAEDAVEIINSFGGQNGNKDKD
jgi:hypothetical protein